MNTRQHVTRRSVIKGLAFGAGTGMIGMTKMSSAFAADTGRRPGINFGVQLNAFPIDPKNFQTFLTTLAQVKQIGYQGFESGFRNVTEQFASAPQARRQIEQTGLTFFGIHIFFKYPDV